ncbi:MAG: hypothetical protein HQ538_01555 [Parcubacteria group bacterium]|nr:hypothetical protein [Parcubacteria group bacterium]
MEKIENLTKTLTKAGATGIIITLIALLAYNTWNDTKKTEMNNVLIGNHIDHSTSAIDKQADATFEYARSNVAIAEAVTELSTIIQINK